MMSRPAEIDGEGTMTENTLRMGEPRLCHLIDGNPDTPEAIVMLRDTGNAIEAVFPISRTASGHEGPYDRWWPPNVEFGDDPDRTKHSYEPPDVMLLHDTSGTVVLVGCHATGWARTAYGREGVVVANFAVLGAGNLKYDRINGMRSSSSAYRRWMGRSSIRTDMKTDESGRLESLGLELQNTENMAISRRLNMSARGDWVSTPILDGYDVRESLSIQTLVKSPRRWWDHLDMHIGVLNLVSLSAWRNCTLREIRVNRRDDPMTALGGNVVGEQWLEVSSHLLPGDDLTDCESHFLFSYDDMRKNAIDTWLRLRKDYERALDYLLRILRSGHTWTPQSAIMSGIALEQLGYLIADHNHDPRLSNNKNLRFNDALRVILDDMDALPFDREDAENWIRRCNSVYMGAKHADRAGADHLTMLNTLRENLLVLRYWIAQRLGVSGDVLDFNLAWDPLGSRFRMA